MEITYTQIGDYLYPNITLGEDDKLPIGKYGRIRLEYLREHRPVIYNVLAVQGKLQRHLWEIDQAANERLERVIPKMKKQAGITEQLKAEDQMAWVGQMNALKQQAEGNHFCRVDLLLIEKRIGTIQRGSAVRKA